MGYIIMVHVPGTPEDDSQLDQVMDYLESESIKVTGLYYIPNRDQQTCRGNCSNQTDKKKNGFSRDPEFGYDIHECGKPTPGWRSHIGRRMVPALGYNLIDDAATPVIFRDANQIYRLASKRKRG